MPFAELDACTQGTVAVPGDEDVRRPRLAVEPGHPGATRRRRRRARPPRTSSRRSASPAGHGLRVTPQATGHGPMAELVTELLVTTKRLDECVVHPEGWARVGAGVKWLRVVEAAAPYGLAPLSGSITDVGVVGYTTGGGLGPMARTYGLAIDKVRAIEVVTGDGVLRRVTPTEHPDLFFGLRGGKGMLGIVTAIEFDLVHQPTFYGGSLWFDGDDAATVIERWRHWSDDLPELGTTSIALFQLPEMPGVPPQLAGRLTLSVRYVWTGDAEEGERRFAAIREAAPVLLDDVAHKPYTAIDSVHTDPLDPTPAYEAAAVLTDFPAEAVDALLALTGPGRAVAAGAGRGAPDGRGDRSRWRARERLRLTRRGVLAAHRRHRRDPRRGGPRGRDPGGDAAVDRRAPAAELHLHPGGVRRRVRRGDDRAAAPGDPHLRPRRGHGHRRRAGLTDAAAAPVSPARVRQCPDPATSGGPAAATRQARGLSADERAAWLGLLAVVELLPGVLDSQLRRELDLTHFDYHVLTTLAEAAEQTLPMTLLAHHTNASLTRLSHSVSTDGGPQVGRALPPPPWTGASPPPGSPRRVGMPSSVRLRGTSTSCAATCSMPSHRRRSRNCGASVKRCGSGSGGRSTDTRSTTVSPWLTRRAARPRDVLAPPAAVTHHDETRQ